MTFPEIGLLTLVLILAYWVIRLKQDVRRLWEETETKPPDIPTLTVHDIQMFQSSLAELIQEVEEYTETQLRKMATQTQTLSSLCNRLEEKIKEKPPVEIPPSFPPSIPPVNPTRVVPLSTKQSTSNHRDRDRIIDLYKKGWSEEKIAEELRITKGEVQLVVNLS